MDALDELLRHAESSYSVSSAPRYATSSRAETPHQGDSSALSVTAKLVLEEDQKRRRFDERHEAGIVENCNNPTPVTRKTNGTSRFTDSAASLGTQKRPVGSPVEVKPRTKKSPEVVTIDDSDDDNEIHDASSVSNRTAQKPANREPDENNDTERPSKGPAEKFHRFIEEFNFKDEYLEYSINTRGKPTDFIRLPHVTEKWIELDLRN